MKAAPIKDAVLAIDAFKVAGYDGYQKARVALALLTAQLYRFAASKQQEDTPARADRPPRRCTAKRAAAPVPRAP